MSLIDEGPDPRLTKMFLPQHRHEALRLQQDERQILPQSRQVL